MAEDITNPVHHKKYSFANVNAVIAKNWKWIVIKPVLIFYCFQYAIIQAVTSQVILYATILIEIKLNFGKIIHNKQYYLYSYGWKKHAL